jgi:hypothetical protein
MCRGFRDADIAVIIEEAKKLWPGVDFKNGGIFVCPVPSPGPDADEIEGAEIHRYGKYAFGYESKSRSLYVAFALTLPSSGV